MIFKIKNILVIIFINLFFYNPSFAGSLMNDEVTRIFIEANRLFQKGNETGDSSFYTKAVMRFERLVRDGGIKNGKLFYNMGNAYFLLGNLGHAILNYRKAEKLISGDSNLHQNLDFAISKRIDKIEEKQQTKALKTLLFFHYDFSSYIRSIIFAFFFCLFWFSLCLRLFSVRIMPKWIFICSGLLSAVFLISLTIENIPGWNIKKGVIVANEVIARMGNGTNYKKSFKEPIHAGTEFSLVEVREDWVQIELNDGRTCWVQGKDIGIVTPL